MPALRSPAQQATARANGARSRGPTTAAGKARSARNGTRHGLRGGPFALLPGEDGDAFAELHEAVTADWRPRDAYERRWVFELVACMWRQDRLHALELAALDAAAAESPPTEATVKKLLTFARYGARIDKDIGRALQALRVLRDRPDACLDGPRNGTSEPDDGAAGAELHERTPVAHVRTRPDPARSPTLDRMQPDSRTPEPGAPAQPPPAPRPGRHGAPAGGVSQGSTDAPYPATASACTASIRNAAAISAWV